MDNYPLSRLDYSNDRKQTSLLIKTPIKFVNISSFLCSILLSSPIFSSLQTSRHRRYENAADSDEASETSSMCSERSYSSSIGGVRITEVRVSL